MALLLIEWVMSGEESSAIILVLMKLHRGKQHTCKEHLYIDISKRCIHAFVYVFVPHGQSGTCSDAAWCIGVASAYRATPPETDRSRSHPSQCPSLWCHHLTVYSTGDTGKHD